MMSLLPLYEPFWNQLLSDSRLCKFEQQLKQLTVNKLENPIQGDYPRWKKHLDALVDVSDLSVMKGQNAVGCEAVISDQVRNSFDSCYRGLIPWRKGPFDMFGCFIDSEWQSFMKWNRIKQHLPQLQSKNVLDVGCGNGYYMFKMAENNPRLLMGVDPGLLQIMQFWSVEKYLKSGAAILPLGVQDLPEKILGFDVVFSMGVLYHRKSPIDHILQLQQLLKPGGELVIETLVVEGDESRCLLPQGRYAQMRNVWFLPSVKMLEIMLKRNGFNSIQCVDVSETTVEEQRTTEWMKFHSLREFLNEDQSQTIEGHPLPLRATLVAKKI